MPPQVAKETAFEHLIDEGWQLEKFGRFDMVEIWEYHYPSTHSFFTIYYPNSMFLLTNSPQKDQSLAKHAHSDPCPIIN